MNLRAGHDYHLAETKARKGDSGRRIGWQAECKACGWVGHLRAHKRAADEDAYAHDEAENE